MSENFFFIFFVLFRVLPDPPPRGLDGKLAHTIHCMCVCMWMRPLPSMSRPTACVQGKPRGKIACFSLETALRGRPRNGIYVSVISKNFFPPPSPLSSSFRSRCAPSTVSVPGVHFPRPRQHLSSYFRYVRPPRVRDQFISRSPSQLASILYINRVPHTPARPIRRNSSEIRWYSHQAPCSLPQQLYLFPSKNIFYHLYIIQPYPYIYTYSIQLQHDITTIIIIIIWSHEDGCGSIAARFIARTFQPEMITAVYIRIIYKTRRVNTDVDVSRGGQYRSRKTRHTNRKFIFLLILWLVCETRSIADNAHSITSLHSKTMPVSIY